MKADSSIWQAALGELQLQMTQATFDAWLRGTRLLRVEDGALVVGVKSGYAKDWLENRLLAKIERTLARLAGQTVGVRFEVDEAVAEADEEPPPQPSPSGGGGSERAAFVVPEYDVLGAGFFQMAGYESRFWAPCLGRIAWRVVEIVRETDRRGTKRTAWTPARRWTTPSLAELVPCGRQAIVGVDRACGVDHPGAFSVEAGWRRHQNGAFDRLVAAAVATVERRGDPPRVTYWVSVRNQLGLLRPDQVAVLAPRLQEKHDRWLADHGFDPREWDI